MTGTLRTLRAGSPRIGTGFALAMIFAGCAANLPYEEGDEQQERPPQSFTTNVSYHPTMEANYAALGLMYFKMGARDSGGCAQGEYRVPGDVNVYPGQICDSGSELAIYRAESTEPLMTFAYRKQGELRFLTPQGGTEIQMEPRSLGRIDAFMKTLDESPFTDIYLEDLNAASGELARLDFDAHHNGRRNAGYPEGTTFETSLTFYCKAVIAGAEAVGAECTFYSKVEDGQRALGLRISSSGTKIYDGNVGQALPFESSEVAESGYYHLYRVDSRLQGGISNNKACEQANLCMEGSITRQQGSMALDIGNSRLAFDLSALNRITEVRTSQFQSADWSVERDATCEFRSSCGDLYEPVKVLADVQVPTGLGWPNRP